SHRRHRASAGFHNFGFRFFSRSKEAGKLALRKYRIALLRLRAGKSKNIHTEDFVLEEVLNPLKLLGVLVCGGQRRICRRKAVRMDKAAHATRVRRSLQRHVAVSTLL